MQKIDILNGKPFVDKTLSTRIKTLENETPTLAIVNYATFANPGTTERTLVETTGYVSKEKLFATIDTISNLTSNIAGAQTFTYKLYLGATEVATSVVTVPDALNTLFSVRLVGTVLYSRNNAGTLEYVASIEAVPLATSATADVSTITVVNKQSPLVTQATLAGDYDLKLTCTASVGTATTAITALGGRVTFDNKN